MSSVSPNYDLNTYLAVTLSPSSPFLQQPAALAQVHPAVAHVGQVGQMEDVQLFSVAKFEWERASGDVLNKLENSEGVRRVDVQELAQRTKRGVDEL
jgi:hypothetical protein